MMRKEGNRRGTTVCISSPMDREGQIQRRSGIGLTVYWLFYKTQAMEMMMRVLRVVIDLLAVALHPAAIFSSCHAFVFVLPPERWHHMVILEEVTGFIHQCGVSAAGQYKPLPPPVVSGIQMRVDAVQRNTKQKQA